MTKPLKKKARARNKLALLISAFIPARVRWWIIVKAMDRVCEQRQCYPGEIAWYEPLETLGVKHPPIDVREYLATCMPRREEGQ